ncbi:MAG TPA: hypothetical protein VMI31_12470, partial [Fimbriimonadaceae bacterium]|nr:hypothetical protein [Fimbriimonadaceae bacterium]
KALAGLCESSDAGSLNPDRALLELGGATQCPLPAQDLGEKKAAGVLRSPAADALAYADVGSVFRPSIWVAWRRLRMPVFDATINGVCADIKLPGMDPGEFPLSYLSSIPVERPSPYANLRK